MPEHLEGFSLFLRRWLPATIWMSVIVFLSLDWGSGSVTYNMLRPILKWIDPAMDESLVYEINMAVRKLAHVTEFAILAILVWRAHLRKFQPAKAFDLRGMGFTLVVALTFALLSEGAQYFVQSRTASFHDVIIDMGGAAIGLLAVVGHRSWRKWRKRALNPRPLETTTPPATNTRVLLTADLHLPATGPESASVLAQLKTMISETRPDVCVIAGDIGPALGADKYLAAIKAAAGDVPVAICLGNQDHWLPPDQHSNFPDPATIRSSIWQPAAERAGVTCLDFENLTIGETTLTGGYGHYDLKMRVPTLRSGGLTATLDDYLAGTFAGLGWNDMQHIPKAAANLADESRLQGEGIARRLSEAIATGKQVLVITHTVPFPQLIGRSEKSGGLRGFYDAYAGNTLIGSALAEQAGKIALAICAHTHVHIPPQNIRGVDCMNLGRHRDELRFALYESRHRSLRLVV